MNILVISFAGLSELIQNLQCVRKLRLSGDRRITRQTLSDETGRKIEKIGTSIRINEFRKLLVLLRNAHEPTPQKRHGNRDIEFALEEALVRFVVNLEDLTSSSA